MNEPEGKLPEEEVLFGKLMKKLTGRQVTMPDDSSRGVIRPGTVPHSIVEVTEELLRQLKK